MDQVTWTKAWAEQETPLVARLDDLWQGRDGDCASTLALFDLSVAFDTVIRGSAQRAGWVVRRRLLCLPLPGLILVGGGVQPLAPPLEGGVCMSSADVSSKVHLK